MIDTVEYFGKTMNIYLTSGIKYNGQKDVLESVFEKELKVWRQKKKNKS